MKYFKFDMKQKQKHFNFFRSFPFYGLCFVLFFLGIFVLNSNAKIIPNSFHASHEASGRFDDDSPDFNAFLQKIFKNEVTASTLNLHYTLSDPASADILEYPITFGRISNEDQAAQLASLENMKSELQSYDVSSMPVSMQLTYDVLEDSINRNLSLAPFYYYDELLSSTNGLQCEYPILLAEYTFRSKKDVDDYLVLLSKYDSFFNQVCEFEKEKAKKGLFMNATAVENLIEQCNAFLPANSKKSFWETTFSERLNEIDSISDQEKKSYISQNHAVLQEHVYPAYHKLISILKALKKKGTNSQGLCYFKNGKKYYELLVKSTTGSGRSISELSDMVQKQREKNISELSLLTSIISDNYSAGKASKRNNNASESPVSAAYNHLPYHSPEDIIEHLKKEIKNDFPTVAEVNYTVKNVNEKLQDFLSPAFYLTAPMDSFTENCIYINQGDNYNDIRLFTTLAHEGYPGHLYQTVYSYSTKLAPLRYLIYHGGYTEGWATYVEMLSYHYAGLDQNVAQALMLNQDITLSLYATIDMGVHYDGWSLADTANFLGTYGITDTPAISKIYQAIIENPANYLKYYIGYLEFLNLKEDAKEYYGNDFSERLFHKAVLEMGSAPFYILEKYLFKYYKAAN